MERQGATSGRARAPLSSLKFRSDSNASGSDVGNNQGPKCNSVIEFTKEDVEALLNEKRKKADLFDNKKKQEQMADYIKRLKLCVRWYIKVEEGYVQEKEKLQSELESVEKKCSDTEVKMKKKTEELNETISDLRKTISSLEERIVKEESDKLVRMQLIVIKKKRKPTEKDRDDKSAELDKVLDQKSVAEQKAISNEDLYKQSQEYNISLQQYNSGLQSDLDIANEAHKRLEIEKATIVESLSNEQAVSVGILLHQCTRI
ncbi:hypothetical protein RIF29_26020 [Crotalaria pallida]|uniref:Uncharacterized protein n=1 Tax=Crotalaria pallida TaxID=3830 RepID=A0AAN9EM91_CROPI